VNFGQHDVPSDSAPDALRRAGAIVPPLRGSGFRADHPTHPAAGLLVEVFEVDAAVGRDDDPPVARDAAQRHFHFGVVAGCAAATGFTLVPGGGVRQRVGAGVRRDQQSETTE